MLDWKRPTSRRLGYTLGFLDHSDLEVETSPVTLTVHSPEAPPLLQMKDWWGGEVFLKRRFLRRSAWEWKVSGETAYALVIDAAHYFVSESRGNMMKAALRAEKYARWKERCELSTS